MAGHRSMKFAGCTIVVRITTSDDAQSTRAATACHQVEIGKTYAALGEPIDVRRANVAVSITAKIVPTNVVCDEQHKVGLGRMSGRSEKQNEDAD